MRYIKLIFLLIAATPCLAEPIELHGQLKLINGKLPTTAMLLSYAEESFSDTASIAADGTFTIKLSINNTGLFNVRLANSSYEIILSPHEKVCTLTAEMDNNVLKNIQTPNSPENDAYKTLFSIANAYDHKLNQHFVNCEKPDSCEPILNHLLTSYAKDLSNIQEAYPTTYAAIVLVRMKMPNVAKDIAQTSSILRKGYFAQVPFTDSSLMGTPIYRDMLGAYVNFLIEPKYSMQQAFLDDILNRASAQPLVLKKTAIALFDELYKLPREKMLGMFLAWYVAHHSEVNNAVLDTKVKGISRVMPGQPIVEVTAKDSNGNNRILKDMAVKNKCTLLLFWSSECSHCREEMPMIKELYKKYHAQGFDIYAVSLDYDPAKWKAYIKKEQLPWTHVYITQETQPNAAIDYMVTSTPTMVLINRQGEITHRFTPKNRLENYITEMLK